MVSSRSGVLLLSRPTSKVFLSPYGRVFLNSKQGVELAGLHRILEINEDSPACGTSHKRHALCRINVLVRFKSAVRVRHLSGVFHRIARRNVSNNLFRKSAQKGKSATISRFLLLDTCIFSSLEYLDLRNKNKRRTHNTGSFLKKKLNSCEHFLNVF